MRNPSVGDAVHDTYDRECMQCICCIATILHEPYWMLDPGGFDLVKVGAQALDAHLAGLA
jgi:hypothetical protein